MASNPPGACCASGFKHEGTPVGEAKNIDGGTQQSKAHRKGRQQQHS